MIVHVESNFVLELAFLQEGSDACHAIIDLAESGMVELVIPAVSVSEPYEVLHRHAQARLELHRRLAREIHELARSHPYARIADHSSEILSVLAISGEEEKTRLNAGLRRILECAEIIPIGSRSFEMAVSFQAELNLSPQDSLVYASVVEHLATAPPVDRCFLNRNSKDFMIPDILNQLSDFECPLIPTFDQGIRYIQSRLTQV